MPLDCALSFLSNRKRCKACVQHLLVRHPFVFLTCGKEAKFLLESAQNELSTSHQARQPAEFKHITKRRKRNQQGFP